jgi:hypothetical protein
VPNRPAPFVSLPREVASVPAPPRLLLPFCKTNSESWPYRPGQPPASNPKRWPNRSLPGKNEESGPRPRPS